MIVSRSHIGRAVSASISIRDVSSDVGGVKHTFSGWDSCMQKAYCKWPVIVAIVIGSLIALSIIFCVARCLCCGAECACCCFKCCTSCCPSPRSNRRNNYAPAPQPVYQQPQPYNVPYSSAAPPTYSTKPQFARFDAGKKGGAGGHDGDALPAMPSWDEATNHKVEVEEEPEDEGTEMQHLDPQNNTPGAHTKDPAYPAAAAGGMGTNPATMRSHQSTPLQDPYGTDAGAAGGMAAYANNSYSRSELSHSQPQGNPYGAQHSTPYNSGSSPTYGVAPAARPHNSPTFPSQQGYRGSPVTAGSGYTSPPSQQHGQGGYAPRANTAYSESNYSHGGGYAPSGSTRYEPSSATTATPYQPKQYQAYGGSAATGEMERKAVQGSWRDV